MSFLLFDCALNLKKQARCPKASSNNALWWVVGCSGGDWALERMGAVLLEGTEGVAVVNNTFTRLDSNAIFLSGYNQYARIDANDFSWLGQVCVCACVGDA